MVLPLVVIWETTKCRFSGFFVEFRNIKRGLEENRSPILDLLDVDQHPYVYMKNHKDC